MKIELVKKEGLTNTYLISETKPEVINAIRRAIISEVPVLAIEDVFISKNSSALYDEILAHRLGLIPLTTPDTYVLPEVCKCKGKGCARCTVKFTLKAKGPGMVYARELKSTDPAVKPVYEDMPIVYLDEGQEVELEASAVLGRGKDHAKWSGALAYYKYYPKIKIDQSKIKEPKKCVESCPRGILKLNGNKVEVDKNKLLECDLCGACSEVCEGISVEGDESKFVFTVESWGQKDPSKMFQEAINILKENLETIKKEL